MRCSAFFIYPLTILICVSVTLQSCILDSTQIDDYKWAYLAIKSGRWSLLRKDTFRTNEQFYLYCNQADVVAVKCLSSGKFSVTLPYSGDQCEPLRASINTQDNRNCENLGGILYVVGYEIDKDFLEIYRTCYNSASEQTLYAIHQVHDYDVGAPNFLRPQFTTDRLISAATKASYMAGNVHLRFKTLLGNAQRYITDSRDVVIERGHLAPSGDFLSYDQMRETFKYINVMPQFRGPNRSNWKRIEAWIKNKASESAQPLTVLTGTYGVLELRSATRPVKLVPMYLQAGNKNPIPKWLFKVVRQDGICKVFVTYNNQFADASTLPPRICAMAACPADLNFNTDASGGYSYCCNYASFVRVVGSHAKICL